MTIGLNIYIFLNFGELVLPLILTAIIFFSDFADGWLARRYNLVTKFGQGFDAFADILYVVTSYAVLGGYHILPFVGLVAVLFKFIEFLVTSTIMSARGNPRTFLVFDPLGKVVGILFYITPIAAYALHQTLTSQGHAAHMAIGISLAIVVCMALLSSWKRIGMCMKVTSQQPAS